MPRKERKGLRYEVEAGAVLRAIIFAYPRRSMFQGQVRETRWESVILVALLTHGGTCTWGKESNLYAHGFLVLSSEKKDMLLFVSPSKALYKWYKSEKGFPLLFFFLTIKSAALSSQRTSKYKTLHLTLSTHTRLTNPHLTTQIKKSRPTCVSQLRPPLSLSFLLPSP